MKDDLAKQSAEENGWSTLEELEQWSDLDKRVGEHVELLHLAIVGYGLTKVHVVENEDGEKVEVQPYKEREGEYIKGPHTCASFRKYFGYSSGEYQEMKRRVNIIAGKSNAVDEMDKIIASSSNAIGLTKKELAQYKKFLEKHR